MGRAYQSLPPEIAWVPVQSSNVAAARWAGAEDVGGLDDVMEVEFGGFDGRPVSRYLYLGVTYRQWLSFLDAPSKGKWVWANLRRAGVPYLGPG